MTTKSLFTVVSERADRHAHAFNALTLETNPYGLLLNTIAVKPFNDPANTAHNLAVAKEFTEKFRVLHDYVCENYGRHTSKLVSQAYLHKIKLPCNRMVIDQLTEGCIAFDMAKKHNPNDADAIKTATQQLMMRCYAANEVYQKHVLMRNVFGLPVGKVSPDNSNVTDQKRKVKEWGKLDILKELASDVNEDGSAIFKGVDAAPEALFARFFGDDEGKEKLRRSIRGRRFAAEAKMNREWVHTAHSIERDDYLGRHWDRLRATALNGVLKKDSDEFLIEPNHNRYRTMTDCVADSDEYVSMYSAWYVVLKILHAAYAGYVMGTYYANGTIGYCESQLFGEVSINEFGERSLDYNMDLSLSDANETNAELIKNYHDALDRLEEAEQSYLAARELCIPFLEKWKRHMLFEEIPFAMYMPEGCTSFDDLVYLNEEDALDHYYDKALVSTSEFMKRSSEERSKALMRSLQNDNWTLEVFMQLNGLDDDQE